MAHLIHVGNSLGVRIPKNLIAQLGITEESQLAFKVTNEGLLISPIRSSRQGWAESFKYGGKPRKDTLVMGEKIINKFDQEEWEW